MSGDGIDHLFKVRSCLLGATSAFGAITYVGASSDLVAI